MRLRTKMIEGKVPVQWDVSGLPTCIDIVTEAEAERLWPQLRHRHFISSEVSGFHISEVPET